MAGNVKQLVVTPLYIGRFGAMRPSTVVGQACLSFGSKWE